MNGGFCDPLNINDRNNNGGAGRVYKNLVEEAFSHNDPPHIARKFLLLEMKIHKLELLIDALEQQIINRDK